MNQPSSDYTFGKIHLKFDDQKLTPDFHAWLPNGMVLASSNSGKLVASFDPASGSSALWLGGQSKIEDKDLGSIILEEEQSKALDGVSDEARLTESCLKYMVPLKKEILFAGDVRLFFANF